MAPGHVLNGRYELDDLPIGKGGMGEVWVGRDLKLDREVAVKLIRFPDDVRDEELVRRFVRESRLTARLQHPGVPAVHDVGTHEGRPFMVMQRVHGITVADLVAEHGALPLGWACAITAQTCAVLAAAHAESLVHRDLKPANLILCPDGSVKVLDFGLAVALAGGDSQITRTGQSLGTPAYMAPELVLAGRTSPRTDLYAVGCLLFEMLTGERPFRGATAYAVMSKQVDARPPGVRRQRPDVPSDVADLVRALLAKDPADRPSDASTVFDRVAPHVHDLAPLPGAVDTEAAAGAVRMYASVLARLPGTSEPVPASTPPAESGAGPRCDEKPRRAGSTFDRSGLARARDEARSLVGRSRYTQAAAVLASVASSAGRVLGAGDPDVVSLRFELANVRFDGGDYRAAAAEYRKLVANLVELPAPDPDLVAQCRMQEATCHALSGDVDTALAQLHTLLGDEQARRGDLDGRVLELRKQIVLLEFGGGRREPALRDARELITDAERAGHADIVTELQPLLRDLDG